MFERRLKILLILMAVPAVAIVLRLLQMQVVQGDYYRDAGNVMLQRRPRYFPCLRGDIQDHDGRRLAFDAPAWDICVRYEVIAGDKRSLRSMARRLQLSRGGPSAEQLQASWQAISEITGKSVDELHTEQERIRRQVSRIKESRSNAQGIEVVVEGEVMAHPVVRGLDQNQQAAARVALAAYPWVEVVGGHRREYSSDPSLGHLLGFLNQVDSEDILKDPNAADTLARYQGGDLHGAAGLEAMGEQWLRGRRGMQEEDAQGHPTNMIEPVNGRNFRLTLDMPLHRLIYQKLEAAVAANPSSTGAAAVVLDVPSRQILALVSYPGYDANFSHADRKRLAADELHRPMKFRAIAERYPPGSIVKPIVLAGAWTDGLVNSETRVACPGQLSSTPPHFKCTATHGPDVGPVFAIQHSCNIFFYRVGERMEVPRLSYWMDQAGLGRLAGIGLAEEVPGFLPKQGRYKGESRLTAIGQWDVRATPLQAANLVATVASGAWRPVTIWADDPQNRQAVPLPVSKEALRAVREGMYRAVNMEGGTAYTHIQLEDPGDLVLLGKTGSAETPVGAIVERTFVCKMPDGSQAEFVAANDEDLLLKHPELRPADIVDRVKPRYFPTEEMDPTHAWFAGYLTTKDRYLESSAGGRLNVALVVLIEFGGRGGGAAAPVAGEIVQAMIEMQRGAGEGDTETRRHGDTGTRRQGEAGGCEDGLAEGGQGWR